MIKIDYRIIKRYIENDINEIEKCHLFDLIERAYCSNGLGLLLVENFNIYHNDFIKIITFILRYSHMLNKYSKNVLKKSYIDIYCDKSQSHSDLLRNYSLKFGSIISDVGKNIVKICDDLIKERYFKETNMYKSIVNSDSIKGCLLNYSCKNNFKESVCDTHCDHNTITGVCSPMYFDIDNNREILYSESNLYIKDRHGDSINVNIPNDAVVYQIGQTAQIQSDCIFRATPHYVSSSTSTNPVSRNTFAVLIQPEGETYLNNIGMTYKEFTDFILRNKSNI